MRQAYALETGSGRPVNDNRTSTVAPEAPSSDGVSADLSHLLRVPQQERSRKTLRLIVDAAHEMLEEEGAQALTVTGIASRADTSVGSFYARFDGKEDLIRYLGEKALADVVQEWDELRGEDTPLAEVTSFFIEAFRSGSLARLRALDGEEDPSPRRMERLHTRVLEDLEEMLARIQPAGAAPRVGARLVLAGAEALASDAAASVCAEPEAELARALELYLEAPPAGGGRVREAEPTEAEPARGEPSEPETEPSPPPEDTVDPFDVWN